MSLQTKPEQKIKIMTMNEVKMVSKPWGYEKWIADARPVFPYALKEIFIKAPHKSSLQFHRDKQETNFVQKGRGFLHYSDMPIDADKFQSGGYTPVEIQKFLASVKKRELLPGTVFHVFPGLIHRVEAVEDLLMIETSTVELDDVYRLQDDANRPHGRIESEHK